MNARQLCLIIYLSGSFDLWASGFGLAHDKGHLCINDNDTSVSCAYCIPYLSPWLISSAPLCFSYLPFFLPNTMDPTAVVVNIIDSKDEQVKNIH